MDEARKTAMDYCLKAPTNGKAKALCKVIETFSNRCVAVSMDPKAGTPGVGWGSAMIYAPRNAWLFPNARLPQDRHVVLHAW